MKKLKIRYLSVNDPLNIIPEPTTWNQRIRNHLVKSSIRESDGAYMQRIYYDDCHLYKFSSEDKAFRFYKGKRNRPAYPVEFTLPLSTVNRTEFDWVLDISWEYPFGKIKYDGGKKDKRPNYKKAIRQLQIPEHFLICQFL